MNFAVNRGVTAVELIEVITSKENLNRAYKKVVENKGAGGIDEMTVDELGNYIRENKDSIVNSLRNRIYMPKPVRRVYIPKSNGKKRPLGIQKKQASTSECWILGTIKI